MRNIIGISALYHDSACCILQNGKLVAAAQEERFTRIKHDSAIPFHSFMFCLRQAAIHITDVDLIAFYEDPDIKKDRQLLNLSNNRNLDSYQLLGREQVTDLIRSTLGYEGPVTFIKHHLSHAASAFYYSGFKEASILTIDSVGEWATTSYSVGDESGIQMKEEVLFPNSLGLFYSTITNYLGFEVNEGEYKVMGLAPYGKPTLCQQLRTVIYNDDGPGFRLNLKYFDFAQQHRMFTDELVNLLKIKPRTSQEPLEQQHIDIARSLQVVLEEILLDKVNYLYKLNPSENLCLAGGVALNCVANGKIARSGPFKNIFIQPAANDAGGSIGAAAQAYFSDTGKLLYEHAIQDIYWGPKYTDKNILAALLPTKLIFHDYTTNPALLLELLALKLSKGCVVGWFQGAMEFGPRALGARSILADPRDPHMKDKVNAVVKKREGFRPFAPVVLKSKAEEHFDIQGESPFMLMTQQVISQLDLPAIKHVDGSARVQTLSSSSNPKLAALLTEFEKLTKCPILLNTSFNIKNEPVVCSPHDAIKCFIMSKLDYLVMGDILIDRKENSIELLEFLVEQSYEETSGIQTNIYTFL